MAPTPAARPVGKPRAGKRAKGASIHVRSWPLRPTPTRCREIRTRFFAGVLVYSAVLGEFLARGRAVKADPAWRAVRELPRRSPAGRQVRRAVFRAVRAAHGFTVDAAQLFASSLRRSWVGEQLPARQTRNPGARAFDVVRQWCVGRKGKPRFTSTKRGLHSPAARDGRGALRPKTDPAGRLIGLLWGAGLVIPRAAPCESGRRGTERQAGLADIEGLIVAGKVLSTRIVCTVVDGRDTDRMQLVCGGRPTRRHPVGDGQVSFDPGPSQIAVAVARADGSWSGRVEPPADAIRLDTMRLRGVQRHLDRRHRAGSPDCFAKGGVHTTGRCRWQRSAAARQTTIRVAGLHRRLAAHRVTLPGTPGIRLLGHGTQIACERLGYVSWQKSFPCSVRDRAPGLPVETMRRKAESAGGQQLYEYDPRTTALSQTCLCGTKKKKRRR
jgi:putative transposase